MVWGQSSDHADRALVFCDGESRRKVCRGTERRETKSVEGHSGQRTVTVQWTAGYVRYGG